MGNVRFLKSQFVDIQAEARKAAARNEKEICGLIIDNGAFLELAQVRNKSKRSGGFSFYFNEIRAIKKLATLCRKEIVGTFHSHPVGLPRPGPTDLYNAVDDSIMLVIDVTGQTAALWRIRNKKSKRLSFSLI